MRSCLENCLFGTNVENHANFNLSCFILCFNQLWTHHFPLLSQYCTISIPICHEPSKTIWQRCGEPICLLFGLLYCSVWPHSTLGSNWHLLSHVNPFRFQVPSLPIILVTINLHPTLPRIKVSCIAEFRMLVATFLIITSPAHCLL